MKLFNLSTAFVLGGSIVYALTAFAQDKTNGGGHAPPVATRPSVLLDMADKLKLTDKHKHDIASILQEQKATHDRLLREADQAIQQKRRDREELQNRIRQLEKQIEKLGDDGEPIVLARDHARVAFEQTRRRIESSLSPEQQQQWKRLLDPDEDVLVNSIGMKLKRIPAGSFMMGTRLPEGAKPWTVKDNEQPQHKVTFTRPFYMGVYEVTQGQFKEIMGFNPSTFQGDTYPDWAKKKIDMGYRDDYRPVENVTWYQAQEFCLRLSAHEGIWYRLPSEAEWEYACRAGTTTGRHYGDTFDRSYSGFDEETRKKFADSIHGDDICQTAEVGMRKPSPWGLYDMYGNAMEWCEDIFLQYQPGDRVDPAPENGERVRKDGGKDWEQWAVDNNVRVIRGGTWDSWAYGSATRTPNKAKNGSGFRIVRAIEAADEPKKDDLRAEPESLEWFRDAKFGMFVHWGPASIKGVELGWGRGSGPAAEEYDNLYMQFNPTRYDPNEWVALARAAGMKYLVFTAKHHDGFSMFDSRLTSYTVMHSPFKRDVAAELAEACHKEGVRLGFYYSHEDWHHPDYREKNREQYLDFLNGQLSELCTRYGKVDIIWFDGANAKEWNLEPAIRMIRRLQPGIIINDRGGRGGDYATPEQKIGDYRVKKPWESCYTLGEQWGWKPDDKVKSLDECIRILVQVVGSGGNLLLNVGPMPDGRIGPDHAARLKEMGVWLQQNGESIYGTRGGPFRPAPWGVSTYRDNRIYVHVLDWQGIEDKALELPPIGREIRRASLLGGRRLSYEQSSQTIAISVPPADRDALDTIVVIELDGPVSQVRK